MISIILDSAVNCLHDIRVHKLYVCMIHSDFLAWLPMVPLMFSRTEQFFTPLLIPICIALAGIQCQRWVNELYVFRFLDRDTVPAIPGEASLALRRPSHRWI